ncbi:hypothetical protein Aduo_009338 [Ancylostoma duodenale]
MTLEAGAEHETTGAGLKLLTTAATATRRKVQIPRGNRAMETVGRRRTRSNGMLGEAPGGDIQQLWMGDLKRRYRRWRPGVGDLNGCRRLERCGKTLKGGAVTRAAPIDTVSSSRKVDGESWRRGAFRRRASGKEVMVITVDVL